MVAPFVTDIKRNNITITQTKIMTYFMVVLSKIMVVVMIAVAALTSIQSSSMAQPLPGSIARSLLRDNMDKFDHQAQDLEDYAIWDPSPGYGRGGTGAPIPHPLEKSF
jgi:hypothetical protein